MQTFRLTVGGDGRVEIPDTRPGQVVVIQMPPLPKAPDRETEISDDATSGPIPESERAAIKERVLRRARQTREKLPEPWRSADHGDLLYGDDGLPK